MATPLFDSSGKVIKFATDIREFYQQQAIKEASAVAYQAFENAEKEWAECGIMLETCGYVSRVGREGNELP